MSAINNYGEVSETEVGDTDDEYRPLHMEKWNLPKTLNLTTIAVDFYLLYDLSLDDYTQEERLVEFCKRSVPLFARYTDMVVGGEIRHSTDHVRKDGLPLSCEPLIDVLWNEGGWGDGRSRAWVLWHEFRQTHGTDGLTWAARIFRRFRGGGYGGVKWANIAEILAYYELGKVSAKMFMDFVWGLEHNGGTYFDKLGWDKDQLREVLDLNLHGKIIDVMGLASQEVREVCQGR